MLSELTRGAVIKVKVSEDDVEGNLVLHPFLLTCRLRRGPSEVGAPLQEQIQLLATHRRVAWTGPRETATHWLFGQFNGFDSLIM